MFEFLSNDEVVCGGWKIGKIGKLEQLEVEHLKCVFLLCCVLALLCCWFSQSIVLLVFNFSHKLFTQSIVRLVFMCVSPIFHNCVAGARLCDLVFSICLVLSPIFHNQLFCTILLHNCFRSHLRCWMFFTRGLFFARLQLLKVLIYLQLLTKTPTSSAFKLCGRLTF